MQFFLNFYRQQRSPFRLVIDGHISVLPRAAGASDDAGEVGAGGGVGVLQTVKWGVLRLGAFITVGAVADIATNYGDAKCVEQRATLSN